ncbi:MAG: hypothetical protein HPY65_06575 [Syntrophaceae bacterium]|nr:hypothetical protein [Syntrophaceae bacterium]
MKRLFRYVLILSIVMILFCGNLCMAGDWDVRPVKIKVIDALTKQPLQGIKVYYVLTTWYPNMSCIGYFFYPSFIHDAPRKMKVYEKKELSTNEAGEVEFLSKRLTLKCYERVLWEKVIVNLNVFVDKDWLMKKIYTDNYGYFSDWLYVYGEDELFNINPAYKGFFLTYVYKRDDHEEQLVKDPSYRNIYEMHVLKKLDDLQIATVWKGPPEEYTVELRRAEK